ncbi:MAG: ATP-dependent helicase C-terminal domain-containing protein, partial [Gammaproteobacteria bacterium]
LRQWQSRVSCLCAWCPGFGLPDVDDPSLLATREHWLRPFLIGKTRLSELTTVEFAQALRGLLDHRQQVAVDTHAPTELLVPSGMRRRLIYASGESPVLAVKLQELFGLADTPRIAQDRVPVTLHLLSPRQTPIQVTQDLRGFWDRTYPDIRKSLQGRYPKHPWPEDPWRATATHRLMRRPAAER